MYVLAVCTTIVRWPLARTLSSRSRANYGSPYQDDHTLGSRHPHSLRGSIAKDSRQTETRRCQMQYAAVPQCSGHMRSCPVQASFPASFELVPAASLGYHACHTHARSAPCRVEVVDVSWDADAGGSQPIQERPPSYKQRRHHDQQLKSRLLGPHASGACL